jgi:uncharacterized protein
MRVVLHAPTAAALERARSNLRNLLAARSAAEVCIVANAEAVATAIDAPDPVTDRYLRLCENTLAARGLVAPTGIATVPAAVQELARLQADGWIYIRA